MSFWNRLPLKVILPLCAAWLFSPTPHLIHGQDETPNPDKEAFEASDEVKSILVPLFSQISKADMSRAKVELAVETVMNGEIVSKEESTFQIASKYPASYTIYYKSAEDRMRIFSDGQLSTVAMSPEAFFELPDVLDCQAVVRSSPITLGPYPEPMLALTMAGVDPALTFLSGMNSVDVIGPTKFRGRTDSIRLRGQQDDGVTWDFWVTDDAQHRPLRLLINLTPMLVATGQVRVPQGYELSLRYDFVSWRITGEVDENLFRFSADQEATKYASLEDYNKKKELKLGHHPLLGKSVPAYTLRMLDGSELSSEELKDKIVVLDFWATWCTPCMKAMPVIAKTVNSYADQDVVFFAVNVGENANLVKGFAEEQDWGVDVAVDPQGDMIEALSAKRIPLTLVIGKGGVVEAAHVGYPGPEALAQRFKDELDVLVQGGRIASSKE
ncbi:redoxin family protein [Neorhodopirellula pilleata]|uniref:Thiol-disulfide oxidoreductase ResA n=1 Tax=Neorhodopirellula pilleata TaxID=2714738 RepID=A0A5C6A4Q7_9BACT|nr:redoxin family protein [Neorhodopirellula pilleata]TWT94357.1 Thiol-disulfide oxidoreductase ResA [Neorhodopirellula pilleata]